MALGNTPRKEINFAVEANRSYHFGMQFNTSEGAPFDLTNLEVRLVAVQPPQFGGSEVVHKIAEALAPPTGFTGFNFQEEELALDPGAYPYDLTLVFESGYSTPVLKGYLEVGPNVDFYTATSYAGFGTEVDITVTLDALRGLVTDVEVTR